MMRLIASAISYLFHPILLVYVAVLMAYWIDRFGYYIHEGRAVGAMLIMDFFLIVLFPVVAIGMMAGLKMISGLKMEKREDRIGPLIITLALYIWFFVNVNGNAAYPDSLRFVAFGATLSVGSAFFINNFTKISLHTIGAGSLCTVLTILLIVLKKPFLDIDVYFIGVYRLSAIFVIILSMVIAGAIGSSRLYLKAHTSQEVYGGYLVGVIAQIAAFGIIM